MSRAIPIAIYGSHDASLCFSPEPGKFRVVEFERLTGQRYCNISADINMFTENMIYVHNLINKEYGINRFTSCFYAQLNKEHISILKQLFHFQHFEEMSHHASHAAGAIYQSDYQECLVVSSDSGGHELNPEKISTFCVFHCDKRQPMNHVVRKIADLPYDLAGAYTLMAVPIKEIYKTDAMSRYLSYAGKIMGLAGYGRIIHEWIRPMEKFYSGPINLGTLQKLGETINVDMSGINTISGQVAYNIARTSQHVFESLTLDLIQPFLRQYTLPLVLTGGAALNVLCNEFIRNYYNNEVFVPVNPNDCGLSFGMLALRTPPEQTADIVYAGVDILDRETLDERIKKYGARQVSIKELASHIADGKIIGIMNGNSECGPRALGNRSILCDPTDRKMKNRLNKKVKFREDFRPFAPVVRQQDVRSYFDFSGESRFMSYAVNLANHPLYHLPGVIPAVTHVDSTARVQTVTERQNPFLYQLITDFEEVTNVPVLLNTSLNIKGKPIVATIKEALHSWITTDMDMLYIEGWLFFDKIV